MWNCEKGPNGESRVKVPYFSNKDVKIDGVATGDAGDNNAAYVTSHRFESRDAGSNCLDGKPDDDWMNFKDGGKIGNNCAGGETSYEVPLSLSEGNHFTKILFGSIYF